MTRVFLTGSTKGIGKAIKNAFLNQKDSRVYGIARSNQEAGKNFRPIQLDLASADEVAGFRFPEIQDPKERLVLINNAGAIDPVKRMGDLPAKAIQDNFQINLISPTVLANAFLEMYAGHEGEKIIINISSGAAFRTIDAWAVYCSSKAGLEMLGDCIQDEQDHLKRNTRVLNVSPGVVDTEMQKVIRSSQASDFKDLQRFKALKSEGNLKSPETVAEEIIALVNGNQRGKTRISG